ncbi:CoA transferase [Streptomyces sp. 4F14]|uniref:CoA transferase n=1 Tax=Streptomyces sp. 4F14 TaxID=3394380 RepID=UPI003A88C721
MNAQFARAWWRRAATSQRTATGHRTEVVLAIQNEREWEAFCRHVLRQPGLADDQRFSTGSLRVADRALLEARITEAFADLLRAAVEQRLIEGRIAHARMREVIGHPHS